VFHWHCIAKRLELKWTSSKISFTFAKCALCSEMVKHPCFDSVMSKIIKLKSRVEEAALERLRYEGLSKGDKVSLLHSLPSLTSNGRLQTCRLRLVDTTSTSAIAASVLTLEV